MQLPNVAVYLHIGHARGKDLWFATSVDRAEAAATPAVGVERTGVALALAYGRCSGGLRTISQH